MTAIIPNIRLLALASVLALGVSAGCEYKAGGLGQSKRGEDCTKTADCDGDLACVSGICTLDEFPISETAQQCVQVQCDQASECCSPNSDACQSQLTSCATGNQDACVAYAENCTCHTGAATCEDRQCGSSCTSSTHCCPNVDAGTCDDLDTKCNEGDQDACDAFSTLGCGCDPDDFKCTSDGTCQPRCTDDDECGPAKVCVDQVCVQCENSTDCGEDQRCIDNTCIDPCEHDTQCPAFHTCNLQTGECEEAGCQNDRECKTFTGNVLARCIEDGTCQVPCESDKECDEAFSYGHQKCIDEVCTFVGCETDEECKLLETGDGAPDADAPWKCIPMSQ